MEAVLNCDTDILMDYARDAAATGANLTVFKAEVKVDTGSIPKRCRLLPIPGQMGVSLFLMK